MCEREDGINLKCSLHWHVHISVHSVVCQCTHARTFSYYLRTELMGLKVDVAEFKGWLRWGGWEKTIT